MEPMCGAEPRTGSVVFFCPRQAPKNSRFSMLSREARSRTREALSPHARSAPPCVALVNHCSPDTYTHTARHRLGQGRVEDGVAGVAVAGQQASYVVADEKARVTLPLGVDGADVDMPRVLDVYKHLGTELSGRLDHSVMRERVEARVGSLLGTPVRLIGRLGGRCAARADTRLHADGREPRRRRAVVRRACRGAVPDRGHIYRI